MHWLFLSIFLDFGFVQFFKLGQRRGYYAPVVVSANYITVALCIGPYLIITDSWVFTSDAVATGLVTGALFGIVLSGFFLVNLAVTGEMNYQGGDRKTFYGRYPFQRPDLNFENTGLAKVTAEI